MNDRFKFRGWFNNSMMYDVRPDSPEEVIVMQCTGLRDKNGELIYEGDIVLAPYRATPQVVEWVNEHAAFSIGGTWPQRPQYETEWEIIGNLYENPDLLKI